jgi:outer membrane PBP1 activator LpoA protein
MRRAPGNMITHGLMHTVERAAGWQKISLSRAPNQTLCGNGADHRAMLPIWHYLVRALPAKQPPFPAAEHAMRQWRLVKPMQPKDAHHMTRRYQNISVPRPKKWSIVDTVLVALGTAIVLAILLTLGFLMVIAIK